GIIRIGAKVKPGDYLVGKVTPKGETQLSPEEKLLKAIFGEKARDVRDTSLTVPPGVEGAIVGVRVFSRKGLDKDLRARAIEDDEVRYIEKDFAEERQILESERDQRIRELLAGQRVGQEVRDPETGMVFLKKGATLTSDVLARFGGGALLDLPLADRDGSVSAVETLWERVRDQVQRLQDLCEEKTSKVRKGDELPPGVLKLVKVYISMKRKLSVGDKMAGRHGNKGVVSVIVPEEDMPYLPDGTPVEIVLNPLGLPSRMNVGQILETHLGVAAKALGFQVATPVFDGIAETKIRDFLKDAKKVEGFSWVQENGKARLFDGRTGDAFDQEVWALEAYGAAYTLQELLTVKSDDVQGRTRIYESIVKGDNSLEAGTPESFNVLIKEMKGLGLDVRVGGKEPVFTESAA